MRKWVVAVHAMLAALLVLLALLLTKRWDLKFWIGLVCLLLGLGFSAVAAQLFALDRGAAFPLNVALLTLCWLYLFAALAVNLLLRRALSSAAFFWTQGALLTLCAVVALILAAARAREVRHSRRIDDAAWERDALCAELERAKSKLRGAHGEARQRALALLDGLIEEARLAELAVGVDVSDLDERIRVRASELAREIANLIEIGADDWSGVESGANAIRELLDERSRQVKLIRGNQWEG